MSPTDFAATGQNPLASERAIPVVPQRLSHRVTYNYDHLQPDYAYSVTPAASFNLELRRGDGYWIVRDTQTGIFGEAETIQEAIDDFYLAAAQQLHVLERQPTLSEELSWQREYLRSRIRR
jgi:hypothetical protein